MVAGPWCGFADVSAVLARPAGCVRWAGRSARDRKRRWRVSTPRAEDAGQTRAPRVDGVDLRAFRLFMFGVSATLSHSGLAFVSCAAFGGFIGLASAAVYSQEHAIQQAVGMDQLKGLLVFAGVQLLAQLVCHGTRRLPYTLE